MIKEDQHYQHPDIGGDTITYFAFDLSGDFTSRMFGGIHQLVLSQVHIQQT